MNQKALANRAVKDAVHRGTMPHPDSLACELCETVARDHGYLMLYHHWSYATEHRLDVIPLCGSCHGFVHSGRLPEPRTRRVYGRAPKRPIESSARKSLIERMGAEKLDRLLLYANPDYKPPEPPPESGFADKAFTVGECIKQARLCRGRGLRDLARKVEIHPSTLCRIESGATDVRASVLGTIIRSLRMSGKEQTRLFQLL